MQNYEIITNFMFCKSQFKKERFPVRKKRKTTIVAVFVATDFLGREKRLSKWLENCVAIIFFMSQHKI